MRKIETTLESIVAQIEEYYNPKESHFLTLNGVALDAEQIEIQWIFSSYEDPNSVDIFYAIVPSGAQLPSIAHIIPSAIISQREVVDMFGITIQDSPRGLYLDADSLQKPLTLGCAL